MKKANIHGPDFKIDVNAVQKAKTRQNLFRSFGFDVDAPQKVPRVVGAEYPFKQIKIYRDRLVVQNIELEKLRGLYKRELKKRNPDIYRLKGLIATFDDYSAEIDDMKGKIEFFEKEVIELEAKKTSFVSSSSKKSSNG